MGRVGKAIATLFGTESKDVLLNSPDGWVIERPQLFYLDPTYGPEGGGGKPNDGGTWSSTGPLGGYDPNVASALAIPAVARATNIVVDPVVSVSWEVYKGDMRESSQIDTPLWLTDPQNANLDGRIPGLGIQAPLTALEFWGQWIMSALLIGDGFVYAPRRGVDGQPLAPMFLLNPDTVEIVAGGYKVGNATDFMVVPYEDVIHLRAPGPLVKGRGNGVLRRHGGSMAMATQVQRYASSTLRSGIPSGYLKVESPNYTKEEAEELKAGWMAAHGGSQRSIAVLNSTTTFTPIMYSPVDLELVGMNKWSLLDIALAFGVEPYMLGVSGDTSTYSNVESKVKANRATSWVWGRRIEEVINAQMPRGQFLKIALDELLKADTKDRYAAYSVALTAGWMTRDEVRASENMDPLTKKQREEVGIGEPKPEAPVVPEAPVPPALAAKKEAGTNTTDLVRDDGQTQKEAAQ